MSLLPTYSLNVKETRVFSVKAGGEISNMHWPIDETCPAFYFQEGGFSEPIRSVIPGENYVIVSPFVRMEVCWLAQEPLEVCHLCMWAKIVMGEYYTRLGALQIICHTIKYCLWIIWTDGNHHWANLWFVSLLNKYVGGFWCERTTGDGPEATFWRQDALMMDVFLANVAFHFTRC